MRPIAVALFVCLLAACSREPIPLVLSISTEEPAQTIADAMAPLLADVGIEVDVRPNADLGSILAAVSNGDADLGIVEEPAQRIPGLRTVVPLYPSILHVLYRHGRDVSGFPELISGQNVYAGPVGGTAWRALQQLAQDFRIGEGEYVILPDPWRVEPDVFFILGGLLEPASIARLDGYRLFSFGQAGQLGSGTTAEGIALRYPNAQPFILPDGVYGPFTEGPVLTLTTRTVLVARDDLDPNLTYLIAMQLFEHAHEIAVGYQLVMTELHEKVDPAMLSLPLHRGSRYYIDKDQPGFLERYADAIGVSLTIVAALGSGLVALMRRRKARRKDRIDVYYRRILAIRHELASASDINEYNRLESRIKAIQEEVFGLLIAERLNVDESLTLFLDLSNRVLGEIAEERPAAV